MTFARPSTRAVAATILAATIGLLAPACSSGGSDGAGGSAARVDDSAATIDVTSSTTAATTTAPPATTAVAPTGLPDQQDAAQRLYDAWFADDKAAAATVADPAAVEAMWQATRGDYSLYNKCSTGEFDTSGCLFRGNNGTIQIDLEKRGDLWVVAGAFYSAD